MIDILADVENLKKHVKQSKLPFKKAIIEYYKKLGESQGLEVVENTSIIKNGVDYGRIPLSWPDAEVSFNMEFTQIEEIQKHLALNLILNPKHIVMILNSNSDCKPKKVEEIIELTPEYEKIKEKIILVDLHQN